MLPYGAPYLPVSKTTSYCNQPCIIALLLRWRTSDDSSVSGSLSASRPTVTSLSSAITIEATQACGSLGGLTMPSCARLENMEPHHASGLFPERPAITISTRSSLSVFSDALSLDRSMVGIPMRVHPFYFGTSLTEPHIDCTCSRALECLYCAYHANHRC